MADERDTQAGREGDSGSFSFNPLYSELSALRRFSRWIPRRTRPYQLSLLFLAVGLVVVILSATLGLHCVHVFSTDSGARAELCNKQSAWPKGEDKTFWRLLLTNIVLFSIGIGLTASGTFSNSLTSAIVNAAQTIPRLLCR